MVEFAKKVLLRETAEQGFLFGQCLPVDWWEGQLDITEMWRGAVVLQMSLAQPEYELEGKVHHPWQLGRQGRVLALAGQEEEEEEVRRRTIELEGVRVVKATCRVESGRLGTPSVRILPSSRMGRVRVAYARAAYRGSVGGAYMSHMRAAYRGSVWRQHVWAKYGCRVGAAYTTHMRAGAAYASHIRAAYASHIRAAYTTHMRGSVRRIYGQRTRRIRAAYASHIRAAYTTHMRTYASHIRAAYTTHMRATKGSGIRPDAKPHPPLCHLPLR